MIALSLALIFSVNAHAMSVREYMQLKERAEIGAPNFDPTARAKIDAYLEGVADSLLSIQQQSGKIVVEIDGEGRKASFCPPLAVPMVGPMIETFVDNGIKNPQVNRQDHFGDKWDQIAVSSIALGSIKRMFVCKS